ncbi:hypothetical protein RI129_010304 [Pyrocoelia pectoralis]|uniref:Protein phosphatase 1 regulatory subunit 35 C-terminal domain-containing protein n=1 Tax=Pyrocoelia pectoralis TaxID=417401 RepID=A0AAN7V6H5_9COLE
MDKQTKKLVKKSIIRNPQITKLKNVVINEEIPQHSSQAPKVPEEIEKPKVCFDEPVLCSALKIVDEIETISNTKPRRIKSAVDSKNKKHDILDERATKQLNYTYHQKLYKNLIPLCTNRQPQFLPQVTRDYQVVKDEEPVLSDFYNRKVLPEYSFTVPSQSNPRPLHRQYDGFKLYRTMRNWN